MQTITFERYALMNNALESFRTILSIHFIHEDKK
ncbi:MAG: hypothetical protein BMS9Abin19_1098 [Gammaproteobacteria bacterium]|nr:MAG: hypothetical protein BMS9Abin19_1098 [Gammaproteobacteria bacterium]